MKDKVYVEVDIEGQKAVKELNLLQSQANKLTSMLAGMKKGTEEYANTYKALNEVNAKIKQHTETIGLQGMTIAQLTNAQNKLASEIRKNLIPGTEEYIKKTEELQKVKARIKELNDEISGVQKSTQKVVAQNESLFKSFNITFDVSSLVSGVVSKVAELTSEIANTIVETNNLRSSISQLTGLNGKDLDQMTARVQALSSKFGKDYNEVLQASNALSKQFGISQNEAFTLIEKGFIKGADAGGDFLDKVKEYPVQFKNSGYSAEQFIKIATQEVKGGIYSDKLLDSVKELGLRLKELAPAQTDALKNAFGGKFTDDFVKKMKSGAISTADAIGIIEAQAKKVNLSTAQMQTLIADLGGGPVEDVGGLIEVFKNLSAAQKLSLEATTEAEKAQKTQLELQKNLSSANVELANTYAPIQTAIQNTSTQVQTGLIQGLSGASSYLFNVGKEIGVFFYGMMASLYTSFEPLLTLFYNLGKQLFGTGEIFTTIKNIAVSAFMLIIAPIQNVIDAIRRTTDYLKYLYQNFEVFRVFFRGLGEALTMPFKMLYTIFIGVANQIQNVLSIGYSLIRLDFSGMGKGIAKIFTDLWGTASGIFKNIRTSIEDTFNTEAAQKRVKEAAEKARQAQIKDFEKARAEDDKRQEEETKKRLADEKAKAEAQAEQRKQLDLEEVKKQEEAQKKFLESVQKYNESKLKITQLIEDSKNNLVDDSTKKEIAIVETATQRKIAETQKEFAEMRKLNVANGAELANLKKLESEAIAGIKSEEAKKIDEINKKSAEDEQKLLDEAWEDRKKRIEDQKKALDEQANFDKEKENLKFEEKRKGIESQFGVEQQDDALRFELLLQAENDRQIALLDMQIYYNQMKMETLKASGLEETAEYMKLAATNVQIENDKSNKIVANEKRTNDLKRQARQAEGKMMQDFLSLTIDILSADENARKEYASLIKTITIANIGVGLAREVQGIWENANKNPINAVIPGWGTIFAGLQTGLAIGRAGLAVSKVNSMEKGGVLRGSSHADGGLSVFDNRTGRQVAEVEGNEGFIFSKRAIANNPHLWQPLMYSSQNLNGARVERYEQGGMIGNVQNVNNANTSASISNNSTVQNTSNLEQKLDVLISVLMDKSNQKIKAEISFFEIKEAFEEDTRIRNENSSR